jgi:hypothetical protein
VFGAFAPRVFTEIDWYYLFQLRISLPFGAFLSRMFPIIDWEYLLRFKIFRQFLIVTVTISSFATLFWIGPNRELGLLDPVCFMFDISILIAIFAVPLLLRWIVYNTARKYKSWAGQILLATPRLGSIDRTACWALVILLVVLCVCLLWYSFRYDPVGTVNSSWTVVFG